jgi:error-prone DNA polymerase
MPAFAEFAITTNFSFLRGGSHPEEFVAQAIALGLAGIGIADRNTLAGVVRAHVYKREHAEEANDLRVVTGARLVFADGTPDILAYPQDRAAYGRLCQLLTRGNLRAQKGDCILRFEDLLDFAEGLHFVVMEASSSPSGGGAPKGRRGFDEFWASSRRGTAVETRQTPSASLCSAPPPEGEEDAQRLHSILHTLTAAAPRRVWLAACQTYGPHQRGALAARAALTQSLSLPLIAVNDAQMHAPERRMLQDVVTCIREGVTLESAGRLLEANAERHLKDGMEMLRLFADAPDAVAQTQVFLDGLKFSLDDLRYDYPDELREGYATPQQALEAFTKEGAARRYPQGVPAKVAAIVAHELKLVAELDYAPYFLTVHDIVRFARSKNILCQGRGSAANSCVCFCLGITEVDPAFHDLLFERFISPERKEPPDIDVDFEHERREEVMQYIYARFGRDRAGLAASVTTYRARSSVRETAKVFGLSNDLINALSRAIWGWRGSEIAPEEMRRLGLDPAEPRLALAMQMAQEIAGFPRHLGQHTGGFVITRSKLDTVVPIMNAAMEDRTTVEWDKNDLDALGILKIDVLALGMLSCLRRGFDLLDKHYDTRLTLATIPAEEAAVYAMIQRADTIGVFQIESRAQMSMLPRLRPANFYDLVIEVAIVRPGPIQGDMVHPYLRRRQGIEQVVYPSRELEEVLGKTLGVPLFQEQAMKIAIVAAGFSPGEADRLRRAMATFRRVGTIHTFQEKMVEGMAAKGYDRSFAERCFKQIEGFGEYGFPESHAASFALLVYASCWMKCRYPDVFACALLNAQPMGFYSASQIVRDAREHGVEVREVDVNISGWDCTLEGNSLLPLAGEGGARSATDEGSASSTALIRPFGPPSPASGRREPFIHPRHVSQAPHIRATHALRLGLRQVTGLSEDDMRMIETQRGAGYDSVRDLWLRTGLSPSVLERLAEADAFNSLGLDRREALWAVRGLNRVGGDDDLPLFAAFARGPAQEPDARLPPMPLGEHVVEDYRHLSLSLKAHPVAFVRNKLAARGVLRAQDLDTHKSGGRIRIAGQGRGVHDAGGRDRHS